MADQVIQMKNGSDNAFPEIKAKTATAASTITDSQTPVTLIKIGRLATALIPAIASQNIGAWATINIAQLPDEYKPAAAVRYPIIRQSQTTTNAVFYVIGIGGDLGLNNQGAAVSGTGAIMQTCISWITAS